MTSVQLRQVVKEYDSVDQVTLTGYKLPPALRAVSLDIHDGETMSIVGPSGCGKTTTLRLLAGLEPVSSGCILFGEREVNEIRPKERNVAMVFQDYGLYPTMDIYGNIAYSLENQHLPRPEVQKRVLAAAGKLGLTPLLRRVVSLICQVASSSAWRWRVSWPGMRMFFSTMSYSPISIQSCVTRPGVTSWPCIVCARYPVLETF